VRKLARDGIASKKSITQAICGLFQDTATYKPAVHAYSVIPDSLFYAYSANVDSFVMLSSFLENIAFCNTIVHLQSKFLLVLTNVLVKLVAILGVMKLCMQLCLYTMFCDTRSCAYLDSLGKFGFRA